VINVLTMSLAAQTLPQARGKGNGGSLSPPSLGTTFGGCAPLIVCLHEMAFLLNMW